MLLGDGGDLADGVDGEILGEGLAAEEAEAVHGVPLRQLQQRHGPLQNKYFLLRPPSLFIGERFNGVFRPGNGPTRSLFGNI